MLERQFWITQELFCCFVWFFWLSLAAKMTKKTSATASPSAITNHPFRWIAITLTVRSPIFSTIRLVVWFRSISTLSVQHPQNSTQEGFTISSGIVSLRSLRSKRLSTARAAAGRSEKKESAFFVQEINGESRTKRATHV